MGVLFVHREDQGTIGEFIQCTLQVYKSKGVIPDIATIGSPHGEKENPQQSYRGFKNESLCYHCYRKRF